MKISKTTLYVALLGLSLSGPALARDDDAETPFRGMNIGIGNDQGGTILTGTISRFNGFISNQGLAVDVIAFRHAPVKTWPLNLYIGGGLYISRDNEFSARLPLGVEYAFARHGNIYAQYVPILPFTDEQDDEPVVGYGIRLQF